MASKGPDYAVNNPITDHSKSIMEQIVNPQDTSYTQNVNGTYGSNESPMPPKPDNNLVLAILTTVCCCLPLGIVAIVKASKVNGLYIAGQYEAAIQAATEAKKWSTIGIIIGIIVNLIYFIFYFFLGFAAVLGQ